ncbi:MAG: Fur family transcriptional regulator [Clostridia bacterium]
MEYRSLFREHGMKCTPSRLRVYQVWKTMFRRWNANLEIINQEDHVAVCPRYRILNAFVQQEMVIRTVIDGDDRALYEVKRHEHKHHFVCLRCKEVFPLAGCPLERYEQNLGQEEGFVVEGHRLEIYGYCPNCKEKKEGEESK